VTASGHGVRIRRAEPADLEEIISVCGRALGWDPAGPNDAFFRWKHVDNPFGRSPIWVADDGEIVGVRAMMRWRLHHPSGDALELVRAVDTATLPSHQGLGIFTRLTMAAVEDLTAEGVHAVFNTPNPKSLPGYLKMGWTVLGRAPIAGRPRSPAALVRLARSRTAADKWGTASTVGLDPSTVLADGGRLDRLAQRTPQPAGWCTRPAPDYLGWRYSLAALHYRLVPVGPGDDPATVLAVRVRQRGQATELSIGEVVGAAVSRADLVRLLRRSGADVALAAGGSDWPIGGLLPLPRSGPVLTWRPLALTEVPQVEDLRLSLGTLELF
jgi:GNAT superfamily N-acetyltransferase